jgi:two-component system sensor histidine kinase BarA
MSDLLDAEAIATMDAIMARSGRDVLGKVWKLFIGQAPQAAARLVMMAVEPVDAGELSKQAHALKSMCLSAGAARVAEISEAIEKAARAGQTIDALKRLPDLAPTLDATLAEMQKRLATRSVPAAKQA